ncbi:hypothetical protein Vafri_6001 [Volvox africanus]|nr:hypothetical protein Vafri_6001 [Volvox africanus]
MDHSAAAARLPRCWQLLGRILAMDLGSTRSRTLRDLAQSAGRVLRLKVPFGSSISRPAVPTEVMKKMMAGRTPYRNDSGSHCTVSSTGCADDGGFDGDGYGDSDGSCSEAVVPFSSGQPQQPQQAEQQHRRENQHQHHHLHSQPQGRWTPIDDTCESPSLTLRCLLNSSFLSSLERNLRALLHFSGQGDGGVAGLAQACPASQLGATYDMASACIAVDLALRRPGCWPALLAHAPAQQMESLILTMRKLAVAAEKMALRLPIQQTAAAVVTVSATEAAATEAQPLGDPRVLWRLQLIGLLEQCLPFTLAPRAAAASVRAAAVAAAGTAPAATAGGCGRTSRASSSPIPFSASQASSLFAVMMPPVPEPPGPHLFVNLGLCGIDYVAAGGGGIGGDGGGAVWDEFDQVNIDAGPGWLDVLGFGACPAISSPPRAQQERLIVLAAASWLPLLLTTPEDHDGGGTASIGDTTAAANRNVRLVPVRMSVLAVHGGHRVAWQYLLLLSRQCLTAVGTVAHGGWMQLLRRLLIVDQITAVLRLYCTWVKWSQQIMTTETAVAMSSSGDVTGVAQAAASSADDKGDQRGVPAAAVAASHGNNAAVNSLGVDSGDDCATHKFATGMSNLPGVSLEFCELHAAAMKASEVLPTVLDVLETLVAAAPEAIALALADNRKARELIAVAEDLSSGAPADGDGELPYPGAGSPAVLAAQRRQRQQRQRREGARKAALPPVWGPGLPLDTAVVSVLTLHDRHGLMHCLGELSTVREDRFSFLPRGLSAPTAAMPYSSGDVGGWRPLPDPSVVSQQLSFPVCAYEGCTNLEGSSEATLLLRACGGGRGLPAVCYCRLPCQKADGRVTAAVETRGSVGRRSSGHGRRAT